MDTRVATAELGWTAYPNSGVSLFWPKYEKKGGGGRAECFKGDLKRKAQ